MFITKRMIEENYIGIEEFKDVLGVLNGKDEIFQKAITSIFELIARQNKRIDALENKVLSLQTKDYPNGY